MKLNENLHNIKSQLADKEIEIGEYNKNFAKIEVENKSLVENDCKLRELIKKLEKSNEDLEYNSHNLRRQIEKQKLENEDISKTKDEEIDKIISTSKVKFYKISLIY